VSVLIKRESDGKKRYSEFTQRYWTTYLYWCSN